MPPSCQGSPITSLERAKLFSRANLTDAGLAKANLTGALLGEADLTGARLHGANLTGARLDGANLTGAEGLTRAQVAVAVGDAATRLPTGLQRPASWTAAPAAAADAAPASDAGPSPPGAR